MSVFASQHTETVVVGGELSVLIRKLSGSSIRAAREVRTITDMQRTRSIGVDVLKMFEEMAKEREAKPVEPLSAEQLREKRYQQFDRDDLLVRGISAWSDPGRKLPDDIKDLEETAAEKVFRAVVDLALGPITDAEVAEGKDEPSSPSTASSTT